MRGLEDKNVVITGGASGIGLACAQRFHAEGARVLLVDLPTLEDAALGEHFGERMTYIQGDVCSDATLEATQKALGDGPWDVLVNNAGIIRDAGITKMDMEQWDQVIAVNLTAVFRWARAAAEKMRDQQSGVILNAASVVAHYGNYGQSNYVATKAGVVGLTKTLSKELGRFNIRVNAVAPGFVRTAMVEKVPEDVRVMMEKKTPLGRLGSPDEVAACYAFLASDDAAFITGATINIDGGLVLG